ncbi:MAG: AMP-binding enzyme, partial [Gemmatimonadales bacterium]
FLDPVYRTGDIVKPQPDGSFVFVGRRDHMVKTRGYRVELGEIEYQLHQCTGVAAAAVVALPDPDVGARLVAAVVVEPGGPGKEALAAHCTARLPKYAVPECFTLLDEMPYTSTGKVDRQRLAVLLTDTFKASLA